MSSSVRPRQEDMQSRPACEESTRWESFDTPSPTVRSPEETEALIERLNDNLHVRMAGNPNITDSLVTLHRMRAVRARHLRRR